MHPHNGGWLLEAFDDAPKEPYGYLVLDHHPKSNREMRVLSNILPGNHLTVYSKRAI